MSPQLIRAAALVGACALAPRVFPQVQPRVPLLPGQVEREFTPPPALRAPPRPLPKVPALPPVPPRVPELKLTVREIGIEGMTVYSFADVTPYFAPLLGKEVTLEEIYKVAAELTAKYVADGYFLSRVVVPAQEIRDESVRLTAIEGYVAQVRFQGAPPGEEAMLQAYADKIRAVRPLTTRALERYLLLMNDLAGVDARSTLVPSGAGLGAADLVIDFSFTRASGQIGADNRGSRALGPWRVSATGELNSLFGRFDKTRLFASSTLSNEQNYASLFHAEPVGAEGARLAVTAWGAIARPDPSTLGGLSSSESRSWSAGLLYAYPVVRSRALNLTPRAAFVAEEGRAEVNDLLVTEDRLRVLRAGLAFDAIDRLFGSNVVDVELAQGLNALGARRTTTAQLPVTTGKSDFTKLAFYAGRLQPLDPSWSLFAAASGQYAFNRVPSLEAFAVGGEYFGRGYDPSEIVGDSGASLKIDLQRELGALGGAALSGYGFYDLGAVYRRAALPVQLQQASLASLGIGLRVRYGASLYGYVEAAKPLTRTPALEGDKDARVYGGLFASF
jgi:hemolysin activation/secretion protein